MGDPKPLALAERPTRVRWLVLSLACGLSFLLYLHRYTWGIIKEDVQKEFGWNAITLGWIDGCFPLSYGVGQIPSGILCDWFGARLLLGGSVVLWSLALALVVVATGVLSMAVARLTFGMAQASCYPVLGKVSKNWFPLDRRPAAQALIATFFGRGGGAAAFLLVGMLLLGVLGMPWRLAVLLLSAVGVAAGMLFLLLFRNTPREHPWANQAEADLVTGDDPEAAYARHSLLNWRALLGSPSVGFLCARAIVSNMADVLYVYWIPYYLRTVKQVTIANTGWMAALPLLGGAGGGIVSGLLQSRLLRRTGERRWSRAGVGMAGKLAAALLMLSVLTLNDAVAVAVVFLVVKFFSDWEQPAEWGATTDLGGRNAATVFAFVNTAGSLGGFIGGLLIGIVLHANSVEDIPTATGWNAVFLITALEYVVAASCWLGIDPRQPLAP
jgi:sugar phosphate permease